ncbi:hypothetical protein IFM89_016696 [Coptis chinensis]|uniref:CUE domain-containing protein n=1 Tax=Coptis chinensis TaxID=261450 RepID=A0A835M9B8_9MAGN|nr:hypothetical protein IFM89_016696 [Coptis chinensis]
MSSSRSTYNNNNNNRGAGFNDRTQKQRFVPKTNYTSSSSQQQQQKQTTSNSSLTTSLRETNASSSSATSASRVKFGGNFVNYLAQDEAVATGLGAEDGGLDPVESQRVVDLLNRELSRFLKLNPKDFWTEVASDTSLHEFLDSFLQFRKRWYDYPHHGTKGGLVAGVIVGELELCRRVFMALYRISSNRDPGARASDSLSAKEHGALLQGKKLLDLPKLLDICAIYGHENEELTKLLVTNAMQAQPMLHENLSAVVSHFLSVVQTMHQRCDSLVETSYSSGGRDDPGDGQIHADLLEVMDFINDAVASLNAFVNAYNPAAVYFSCPVEMSYGSGELLSTLARLHDSLLPSLQQGFGNGFTAEDGIQNAGGSLPDIATSFKILSMRIINLFWNLLNLCYLSNEVFEGCLPHLTSTKMFPSNVEDPVIRGDILVQTFREISEEVSRHTKGNKCSGTLLQKVQKNYSILSRLDELRGTGWIYMESEQFQYVTNILMPPSVAMEKDFNRSTAMGNKMHMDENAAIIESKISQIKDLFPDYGKGFLAACLEAYNQNPEEVIQRILEGTLHKELQSMDISLDMIPPPKSSSSSSRNDKGKGLVEITSPSKVVEGTSSSSSSSSLPGRYTRKTKHDLPTSKALNSRGDGHSAKTAILASQYEYEDEYDDSFDDLGLNVVESGFEDDENLGDRIKSAPMKSSGSEAESTAPNKSGPRWNSRKGPQFYVKDGKNYSYKVSGSVAVADSREAALVNQAQKEVINGLGCGGNLPLGAVKKLTESNEQQDQEASDVIEVGGRGRPASLRGRGKRGGGYRKDQAMKKHFAGIGGGY